MLEVARADQVEAAVDGQPVGPIDRFCTDVLSQRWEFNFHLPENVQAGPHRVGIRLGRRNFAPVPIEVG
jgi:hypothetical protein